jgi:DNA polymerase-3 subunit delta'
MWQIVGHDSVVTQLRNRIAEDRVSHAYLFTGAPHIGKRTLSLNLAQALNCKEEERPCGHCTSCHKIEEGIHPDVRIIDLHHQALLRGETLAQQNELRIDTVRAVEADISLRPFEGQRKVFIIPEAEIMNPQAANCLLKTLEEPPPHAVLLLTASDARLLLPTIVSRCQVFGLRLLPTDVIAKELERRCGVSEAQACLIARLSEGRMGWAITAAQDGMTLTQREERLQQLLALPNVGRIDRLDYAAQLSRHPHLIGEVLELWLSWWRDLLLVRSGCEEMITNVDLFAPLEKQASKHSPRDLSGFMKAIRRTMMQLELNANPRLALEVLMLDLPVGTD